MKSVIIQQKTRNLFQIISDMVVTDMRKIKDAYIANGYSNESQKNKANSAIEDVMDCGEVRIVLGKMLPVIKTGNAQSGYYSEQDYHSKNGAKLYFLEIIILVRNAVTILVEISKLIISNHLLSSQNQDMILTMD